MKIKITMAAILTLILSGMMTLTVHAESDAPGSSEPTEYQYYFNYIDVSKTGNKLYTFNEIKYRSNQRLCFITNGKKIVTNKLYLDTEVDSLFLLYYGGENNTNLLNINVNYNTIYKSSNGDLFDEISGITSEYAYPYPDVSAQTIGDRGFGYNDLDTNIPIFRNFDDVENYFLTGDTSAAINGVELFNTFHDFAADKCNTNIPVPDLKFINYDGFTVINNDDGEYYIDLVVKSKFLGVKFEKQIVTWFPVVDPDWVYAFHYYNFVDSGFSRKMSQVDLPSQYGISPQDDLIYDFQKWSIDYSSPDKLPSYSTWRHYENRTYKGQHTYENTTDRKKQEAQLIASTQAQISYYVRFRDDNGNCSPWVMYDYSNVDKVIIGQTEVNEQGNIVVDDEGMPVIKDELTGKQVGTGEIILSSDSGFEILDFLGLGKLGDMFDYIKGTLDKATESIGSFGSLISACLSFLPQELIGFIVLGIVLMILIGIIKVVKG